MYFFIEFSRDLQSRFEAKELDYQDFYVSQSQKFYSDNSLPSFNEWGDGLVQGDASDEEVLVIAEALGLSIQADEDGEYDFSEVFEKLDRMFVAQMKDASDHLFEANPYSATQKAVITALENAIFYEIFEEAIGCQPEDVEESESGEEYAVMFNVETDRVFILEYAKRGNGWAKTAESQNPWILLGYLSAQDILMGSPEKILKDSYLGE